MEVDFDVKYSIRSFGYYCTFQPTSNSITHYETTIRELHGDHVEGKTNTDVKWIVISKIVMHYFPKNLAVLFPNVHLLEFNECELKEISRQDLKGFEKIFSLDMNNNFLTSLPDDLFINLNLLFKIGFSNNNLEFLSSKLLQPLVGQRMYFINFQKNSKIDLYWRGKNIEELMQRIDALCLTPAKVPKAQEANPSQHRDKFAEGIKRLWTSGKFSDFIINLNGSKGFKVHKNVLAIQSLGFAEMFEKDENATGMKIEDLSAEAVEEFLWFLYTGELSDKTKNATEIFALSTRLKVPELKSITEQIVAGQVSDTNAYSIFVLGHRYASETVTTAAFAEIQKMFPDKILPENLKNNPEKLKELIESLLKVNEALMRNW